MMDLADFFSESNMSALARKQEREIWGNRTTLPEDESRIAFNFKLTHAEKMEKLTALRTAKATRRAAGRAARIAQAAPKTFEQRLNASDVIQARGMGFTLH
jgi:ABC-type thiamine transport system substrate-binding protein